MTPSTELGRSISRLKGRLGSIERQISALKELIGHLERECGLIRQDLETASKIERDKIEREKTEVKD